MELLELFTDSIEELKELQIEYKAAIGEAAPTHANMESLRRALAEGKIQFFGCKQDNRLVACCSISKTYSTFDYSIGGVFEDFYIRPEYRHHGIARKLIRYAFESSGVSSLTVGCADCDMQMYQSLGFNILLGNMMAFGG